MICTNSEVTAGPPRLQPQAWTAQICGESGARGVHAPEGPDQSVRAPAYFREPADLHLDCAEIPILREKPCRAHPPRRRPRWKLIHSHSSRKILIEIAVERLSICGARNSRIFRVVDFRADFGDLEEFA
jgi:hypothetical protein